MELRILGLLFNTWFLYVCVGLLVLWILRWAYNIHMGLKWVEAITPEATDFGGAYRVYILPRWLFFWFRNVKNIEFKGNLAREGFNLAYSRKVWGRFLAINWRGVCFDYSKSCRGSRFPFRLIRDFVKVIRPGVYLGKFFLHFWGRDWFVFWFILKKA